MLAARTERRLDHAAIFTEACRKPRAAGEDVLELPGWSEAQWSRLLALTVPRAVQSSEIVIQRGADERTLYFVSRGQFEVGSAYVDGTSFSPLARISVGSVIGEQSFFDALPRSANVWASGPGELLSLRFDAWLEFAQSEPALARDLLFAISRVLSLRLRNTSVRVRR